MAESISITRRNVIKGLTLGAVAGSVLRVIPLEAAQLAHHLVREEVREKSAYTPKFFRGEQFKLLQSLCQTILPADASQGGADEAGAPEFIDLLTSENHNYQAVLGAGLAWLDKSCLERYGRQYLSCHPAQQEELLQLIAYKKNAAADAGLRQPVEFFAFLRKLTADGYFTSAIGIKDLQYVGNTALREFPGCPAVPD